MPLITVSNISKSFAQRELFTDVSFDVDFNDRIGLVGNNGCGKTTLFKILRGTEDFDNGDIYKNRELKFGFMSQNIDDTNVNLYDYVLAEFLSMMQMEKELETVIQSLTSSDLCESERKKLIEKQDNLRNAFYDKGGLTFRSKTKSTLLGLGFSPSDLELCIDNLSGGQRNKAQLARVLLSCSNLLLLDEPTNHLDIEAVNWLEDYLLSYQKAFIVISHDRYFLDKVTNKTLQIKNNKLFSSKGNYSKHLELTGTQNEIATRHYLNTQKEIKRISAIIEQQKRWNQERNYITIASKLKQIDRLKKTLVEPEKQSELIGFDFRVSKISGNDVLIADSLSKSYGENHLFSSLNLHIKKGDKVFLLGDNGCGKTTLLKIFAKLEKPDSGTFYYGSNVQIGYYEQNINSAMGSGTLLDEIHSAYPTMNIGEIRNAMAQFLFKDDEVHKAALLASGGERARIQLLKLMLSGANLLFLDEPTNHLDIDSRTALENALENYDGTMLVVSHDRYLVNRLADRVLHITDNTLAEYLGGYDEFLAAQSEIKLKKETDTRVSKPNPYQLRKELNSLLNRTKGEMLRIEKRIHELEERIEETENQLAQPDITSDYIKVIELSDFLECKRKEIEKLYHEWEQVALRLEELESSEEEMKND